MADDQKHYKFRDMSMCVALMALDCKPVGTSVDRGATYIHFSFEDSHEFIEKLEKNEPVPLNDVRKLMIAMVLYKQIISGAFKPFVEFDESNSNSH